MSNPSVFCRNAVLADLDKVVEIHIAAFPGFFLTMLGPSFIRLMYKSFLQNEKGIFLVAGLGQVVSGFAVGMMHSAGRDWKLGLKYMPQFACSLILPIARHPLKVLKRLSIHIFSKSDVYEMPGNSVLLRSIGVSPGNQGNGLSAILIKIFEENAAGRGAEMVVLTTDADNNDRAINFYRKHQYVIQKAFKQDDSRSMLLLFKKLN